MRDISSIKDRLKDEQPKLHSQAEINITSVKLSEIAHDPVIKETQALNSIRQRFKTNIQTKQKELTALVDIIKRNRQLASEEIKVALEEAKIKASQLISQSASIKNEANHLLNINTQKEKQLKELDQTISNREVNVSIKETDNKIKQQNLADLEKAINRNKQLTSEAIEKILQESQIKAKRLIAQAEGVKNEASTLLNTNVEKSKQLEKLEQEITKREMETTIKEDRIKKVGKMILEDEEISQQNLIMADKRYQEAVDCYISAISLLAIAIDQLKNLRQIRNEVSEAVYQNLERIGIIEKRVITSIKLIDGDKLLLQKKAIELQDQEKYLRDREEMLNRTAKEVDQKVKNYGK